MRKSIVMAMVALLVVGLAAPAPAEANHNEMEWLQATCTIDPVVPSLTNGSMHVRGETHSDTIYMDPDGVFVPVGTNTILFTYDLSVATLNGRGGGTFSVELFGAPAPAFVGHFNGQIAEGMLRAQAVGKGYGAFEGDLLKATIRQIEPLEWMCGDSEPFKAVAVTARIIDK